MSKDSLGNRMKFYEGMTTNTRLLPNIPVIIRLDGVSFHTFTKGLRRPYDERLSKIMIETTRMLVQHTNARVGYTQSDEITLLLFNANFEAELYFAGKLHKILSVLAARTSVYFNSLLPDNLPEKADKQAVFDCRAWNVPLKEEAFNTILWREKDATRNSVSMAAQANFSHKELQNKSVSQMHEMLFQKGINWNDYPTYFKRGTYIQRREVERAYTQDELTKLPPKHQARLQADFMVKRSEYREIDLPPLTKVGNPIEVLFDGADPTPREPKTKSLIGD